MTKYGVYKGHPLRYVPGHQHRDRRGAKNGRWKGGRIVDTEGYVRSYAPGHPHARTDGYVFEHRLVLEQVLGRYLEPYELVHHKDGNRANNDPDNLALMSSWGAHTALHGAQRAGRWARDYDCCVVCGSMERKHAGRGLCVRCHSWVRSSAVDIPEALRGVFAERPWAEQYACCQGCGTTKRRHMARGLCALCYQRARCPDQGYAVSDAALYDRAQKRLRELANSPYAESLGDLGTS